MNTPTELAGFIEYRLCQLRIQNLHHDFEHLCRDLARARIVSNILPATGPVAGKGDQGRDFETFRTYLAGSLRFSKGFIGLASEDTVVFACTVQHKDLTGKIKADVASICRQGTPVDRIYFLCTEAYNAADRHSVQEWAASEFQVKLEVLDGPVIAELLSDHEVFWIAKTYLHLPAELSPAPQPSTSTTPTWYQRLKGDWDQADRGITNFGELMQVVEGLRHATDNRDARTDLDSWLRLVEAFLSGVSDVDTAQRARYELSRATLRGTGDMRPAEHHVRSFFANVPSMTEPRDLQDAGVLLQYLETASRIGESSLSRADIQGWTTVLLDRVTSLLDAATSPGLRAGLLDAAAHLSLRFDAEAVDQLAPRAASTETPQHRAPDDLAEIEIPDWMPLIDIEHGMAALLELVSLLPQAPLFPIGALARHFDLLTPVLVDHPLYAQVRSGLDEATNHQAGSASTAARCRKRAIGLYKSGRRLAALRELHEAKVNWWHGDTVRQSILAMLFIAHLYSELLLPQAAKKYALAAGFAAMHTDDHRVRDVAPVALFRASKYDHQCGGWISALDLTRVAILLQSSFAADPWNLDHQTDLGTAITHSAVIKAASQHRPALTRPIEQLIAAAELTEEVDEFLSMDGSFLAWDETAWLVHSEAELTGPPFSDASAVRVFSFGALGQRWRVRCRNERAAVTTAEDFCATVQLILAELVSGDPLLLSSTIEIEIELFDPSDEPTDRLLPLPDNTCSRWKIYLPAQAGEDAYEADLELTAMLACLLRELSLLSWEEFAGVLDTAGRGGLMNKLTAVASYRRTVEYFTGDRPSAADDVRGEVLGDPAEFPIRQAPELAAPTTDGPGYSREKSLNAIAARYEHCAAVTRHTLPRVLADPALRAQCRRLVTEGRPEWIVLMALANVVMNFRMRQLNSPLDGTPDEGWRQRAVEEMRREERVGDPSPPTAEIADSFEMQLALVTATVAQFWGLEINRDTPDFGAIETVLKIRYHYWDDDIEHSGYFTRSPGT